MTSKFAFFILIPLVFTCIQSCKKEEKKSILFIGNSFTYRNEMPSILENIALSKGKQIEVKAITKGKATLAIQSQRAEVFEAIKEKKWDYVVVQGSSRDMLASPDTIESITLPSLERILAAIKINHKQSKVLFYMTWAYKNGYKPLKTASTFQKMTETVSKGYFKLYEKYKEGVVPVGLAWLKSRKTRPDVNLYVKDGAHPSWKGSYLAASCFYAAIFNESAEGARYYGVLGPEICGYLQKLGSSQVLSKREIYGL